MEISSFCNICAAVWLYLSVIALRKGYLLLTLGDYYLPLRLLEEVGVGGEDGSLYKESVRGLGRQVFDLY